MVDPHALATNPLGTLEQALKARDARGQGPQISLIVFHQENTRVVRLTEGQALVIGRDPSAEISIAEGSISRRHACFSLLNGVVTVSDLGSTNGTKINGEEVEGKAVMRSGDEVTVGMVTISIHALAPAAQTPGQGLLTHDQFLVALDEEVARAQTFRRGLVVVMVRHAGEPAKVRAVLHERLRTVDRAAVYADGAFEWLMPEVSADEAAIVVRVVAAALRGAQFGIASYPAEATSAEGLLAASREAMHRATASASIQSASAERQNPRDVLLSASPLMREVHETIDRVASSVMPVLIRGETGTGKEVLARSLHEKSKRRKSRMVSINCGAIPTTLVESVLFGHEKGAFTGAISSAPGLFEEADGSTVLLDEIGELSPAAQAALLRVLETKEVRRVGAHRDVPVDVRVLAATHRDLEAMVKAGTFREDLLYRLNAMTLEVPPLRERPEDVGPFAERFVALANAANDRDVKGLDVEAMRVLLRYPWPGNIRELRNAIEHAVVVAQGKLIAAVDLPRRIRELPAAAGEAAPRADKPVRTLRDSLAQHETQAILEALQASHGNRTEAAKRLKIPVRTLSHKIRQYGIKKLGFGLEPGDKGTNDR